MMPCPNCGAATGTLETRTVNDGGNGKAYVRRRRQCKRCGGRITTSEVIIDPGMGVDIRPVRTPAIALLIKAAAAMLGPELSSQISDHVDRAIAKARAEIEVDRDD